MNQPTDIQRKTVPVYIGIVFFFLFVILLSLTFTSPTHATTLRYDQMGNVIDIDGTKQYEYDTKGRLKSATDLGTGNTTQYQYDHSGNRVLTIGSNGTVHITPNKYFEIKNGKIIKNIYAGDQLIATIESDGLTQHTSYIHSDHLSGANVITDDNGNIIQTNDYYPFGDQRINDQPTEHNHTKTFTGYDYDQDTGLYYAGQRYYNPQIGRFISQDALHNAIGDEKQIKTMTGKSREDFLSSPQLLNSYAYTANNPINRVDPTGESSLNAWIQYPYQTRTLWTALQTGFWWLGSKTYLQQKGYNASAHFLNHSLSLYPRDIHIDEGNDNLGLIAQIKGSSEYADYMQKILSEEKDSFKDRYLGDNGDAIKFKSGDLLNSIGGTEAVDLNATKVNDTWELDIGISDRYDFKMKNYEGSVFTKTANNLGVLGQKSETLSNYNVTINFKDKIKLK